MLLEKHKPKKILHILGQDLAVKKLLFSLKNWKKGRAIVIFGPAGIGKSASLHAIAAENKSELVEIDTLDSKKLDSVIPSVKQRSLLGKKKIILIESADRIRSSSILDIIKKSIFPIFLIVENPYIPKLKTIRNYSDIIEFRKFQYQL